MEFMSVEKNASHRTLANYEHALLRFVLDAKGFVGWRECRADDFRLYLYDCMQGGMARATVRLRFAALRSFYKFLVQRRGLAKSPLMDVPAPLMFVLQVVGAMGYVGLVLLDAIFLPLAFAMIGAARSDATRRKRLKGRQQEIRNEHRRGDDEERENDGPSSHARLSSTRCSVFLNQPHLDRE